MDTVDRWALLRALRVAGEAAREEASATAAALEPTHEHAFAIGKAVGQRFVSRVEPAFRRALDAGISRDECLNVLLDGAALGEILVGAEAHLRRAEEQARRTEEGPWRACVQPALAVDALARRQALRKVRAVGEAVHEGKTRSHGATVVAAVRDAVKEGVPIEVALDVLERAGAPVTRGLGPVLTERRTHADDAAIRVRTAILLPVPGAAPPEPGAADVEARVVPRATAAAPPEPVAAAGMDAHDLPARPPPELAEDVGAFEADLRSIDEAAAALLGRRFTEAERRVAVGLVNDVRTLGRMPKRAQPRRRFFGGGRGPRASRASRRPARRSGVALTRDGPPPRDGPALPGASRSPHGAVPRALRPVAPDRQPGIVRRCVPPPYDLDAEAALLRSGEAARFVLAGPLPAEPVDSDANRRLGEAAHERTFDGCPVDVVAVASLRRDQNGLVPMGGPVDFAPLTDATPAVRHVEPHAQTEGDKRRLRATVAPHHAIAARSYDDEGDVGEFLDAAPSAPFSLDVEDEPDHETMALKAGVRVVDHAEAPIKMARRREGALDSALRYVRAQTLAHEPVRGIEDLAKGPHRHRRTASDAVAQRARDKRIANEPERIGPGAPSPRLGALSTTDVPPPPPRGGAR
jgi:hypothetical protein